MKKLSDFWTRLRLMVFGFLIICMLNLQISDGALWETLRNRTCYFSCSWLSAICIVHSYGRFPWKRSILGKLADYSFNH